MTEETTMTERMPTERLKGGCPSQTALLRLCAKQGASVLSSVLVLKDGSCLHLTHVLRDAGGIAAHCHSLQLLCEARASEGGEG